MQIYTHVGEESRDDAITGLDRLLGNGRQVANLVSRAAGWPRLALADDYGYGFFRAADRLSLDRPGRTAVGAGAAGDRAREGLARR